jgi:O-antigen ligase
VISGVSLEAGVYFGMSLFVLANALDLLLLSEPKRNLSKKLFSFVVILIIMYSIFLSGTRGILLSALAVLVSQIYSKRFSIKMILITTLVVILVFLIYSNYLSIELQERFTVEKMISSRASSRFDIWLRALNFLSERGIFRNIFGDGLYSTKYILGHTTDNTVIDVIIEFGLIGLVFFISMHISLLIEEIKTSNTVAISTHMGIIIWQLSVPLNLELVYWVLIFLIYSSNISRREMVKYSPKKSKKLINWQ